MKVIDQLGNTVQLAYSPKRIISVVPSQTELLFDLGLDEEIIGITKFCIHPKEKTKSKQKIGGTKKLDIEKIISLNPDLIIANKEENDKAQIELLATKFPVWISDVVTLDDAYQLIIQLGIIVGKEQKARELVDNIKNSFASLLQPKSDVQHQLKNKTVAYLIWSNPYMCAGSNTFINYILESCLLLKNIVAHSVSRYPEITAADLKASNPDFIFLSSEPFPFKEKHLHELQQICPTATIKLVDGELFSWYGSRLQRTPNYLENLLF
ncbi:MAG: ABC transporter substrate-binding protein [Bacteroidetes bacterium]|nr:ABC transporter substrate-binding protein [Bacteroidota bacterium]